MIGVKITHWVLPEKSVSVHAISFSRNGNLIAAADFSLNNTVYVYDILQGNLRFKTPTGDKKILMIDWSLKSDTKFCTVGPNHLFFWNITKEMKADKDQGI